MRRWAERCWPRDQEILPRACAAAAVLERDVNWLVTPVSLCRDLGAALRGFRSWLCILSDWSTLFSTTRPEKAVLTATLRATLRDSSLS